MRMMRQQIREGITCYGEISFASIINPRFSGLRQLRLSITHLPDKAHKGPCLFLKPVPDFPKCSQTRPLSVRLPRYNTAINPKQLRPKIRQYTCARCRSTAQTAQEGTGHEEQQQEDSRRHSHRSDAPHLRHRGFRRFSPGQPFLFHDGDQHIAARKAIKELLPDMALTS